MRHKIGDLLKSLIPIGILGLVVIGIIWFVYPG